MVKVMHFLGGISIIVATCVFLLSSIFLPLSAKSTISDQISDNLNAYQPLAKLSVQPPTIAKPDWYYKTTVYYTIGSSGTITADLGEFATLVNQTLNDTRGWARMGVRFEQVQTGGTLHVILSEASLFPSYSSGCSADWSCTVGNSVLINTDRWTGASNAWNSAGGSLRDYRHMVVNHETGHWLGHGHEYCSGAGKAAPVMQQQSIDLQGCTFNPWPLDSELWSSRLSI